MDNKDSHVDTVYVAPLNDEFFNVYLMLGSTIVWANVKEHAAELEFRTFKIFRKALNVTYPLRALLMYDEYIFASDSESKTVVYSMTSKRSTVLKLPCEYVCYDSHNSSTYDVFILYSVNSREGTIEVYRHNYQVQSTVLIQAFKVGPSTKGLKHFGFRDKFYYMNKNLNNLNYLSVHSDSGKVNELFINVDTEKQAILRMVRNECCLLIMFADFVKVYSLDREMIVNRCAFAYNYQADYFSMSFKYLLEQNEEGLKDVTKVNLYSMELSEDFKNKMAFDGNSQYAVFDMRKAYTIGSESTLGKLSETAMSSEKKSKPSSYESQSKFRPPSKQKFMEINKPVTFHSKIKSNGYGKVEPKREMFKPKTNSRSNSISRNDVIANTTTHATPSVSLPTYPESTGDINIYEEKYSIGLNDKIPILASDVDCNATKYAVGHTDGKIYLMNLKKGTASSFLGFNGQISNVQFGANYDSNLLLGTSPKSKSVKLFNIGHKKHGTIECNLEFDYNPNFAKLIYHDQMVAVTHANKMDFYKYQLCDNSDELIKHYSKNNYKLVNSIEIEDSKKVTALEATNIVKNNYVICGFSDHTLNVVDLSNNKIVRSFKDDHQKAITRLKVVDDHDANLNLLYSSSNDNSIKLWDLRMKESLICTFGGHTSTKTNASFDVSYNNNYIVTGSDDRAFYIYDARVGSDMSKALLYRSERKAHHDAVATVNFMGRYKSVVTGCMDGHARIFRADYINKKTNRKGGSNKDNEKVVKLQREKEPGSNERVVLNRQDIEHFSPHKDYLMI